MSTLILLGSIALAEALMFVGFYRLLETRSELVSKLGGMK